MVDELDAIAQELERLSSALERIEATKRKLRLDPAIGADGLTNAQRLDFWDLMERYILVDATREEQLDIFDDFTEDGSVCAVNYRRVMQGLRFRYAKKLRVWREKEEFKRYLADLDKRKRLAEEEQRARVDIREMPPEQSEMMLKLLHFREEHVAGSMDNATRESWDRSLQACREVVADNRNRGR